MFTLPLVEKDKRKTEEEVYPVYCRRRQKKKKRKKMFTWSLVADDEGKNEEEKGEDVYLALG